MSRTKTDSLKFYFLARSSRRHQLESKLDLEVSASLRTIDWGNFLKYVLYSCAASLKVSSLNGNAIFSSFELRIEARESFCQPSAQDTFPRPRAVLRERLRAVPALDRIFSNHRHCRHELVPLARVLFSDFFKDIGFMLGVNPLTVLTRFGIKSARL